MKNNSRSKAGNIFESIKKEEENEQKEQKKKVETSIKTTAQVKSATKKPETLAKTTNIEKEEEKPENPTQNTNMQEMPSTNPGINYLNSAQNQVETPINNGLLYITPTRKKTRSHRKGFLLSDLALSNLQKEAEKYEISENELINQILEKMIQ